MEQIYCCIFPWSVCKTGNRPRTPRNTPGLTLEHPQNTLRTPWNTPEHPPDGLDPQNGDWLRLTNLCYLTTSEIFKKVVHCLYTNTYKPFCLK